MKNNFKKLKQTTSKTNNIKGRHQGFTLLELMISLAVGLVIFAGVLSVFVGMQSTVKETSTYGELQENARFAISVLTDDLQRQNFFGDYTGGLTLKELTVAPPNVPVTECRGEGVNNGTYPTGVGLLRTLWGESAEANGDTKMSCINDAALNSDVIQLKRVISNPLPAAGIVDGFSYFVANTAYAALYSVPLGEGLLAPVIENSRTWQYQHHIYYVKQNNDIPVLMQWRLTTQMTSDPIIDGIERIYFMYGVSTVTDPTAAGFGVVNAYFSAGNMTPDLWNNINSNIIAVKIYVLARSILPDNNYTNDNTYTLGDQAAYAPDDSFHRLLLSSTVTLHNSGIDIWE